MDQTFQALLLAGKYTLSDDHHFPPPFPNQTPPLPSLPYHHSILSSPYYPFIYTPPPETDHHHHLSSDQPFKKPKPEPTSLEPLPPFTFINPSQMFTHLPPLISYEHFPTTMLTSPKIPPLPTMTSPPSPIMTSSEKLLIKRRTLRDKTRSLQKVLPWDKKMDMATLLEETYKYVKFLQAQVKVLELMPTDSSTVGSNFGNDEDQYVGCVNVGHVYGELGKLNRQQMLKVLVNSPAAQTVMYNRGCCVFSVEQLVFFKDNVYC